MLDEVLLTRRQAARRVERDVRTIRRWQAQGMPARLIDGTTYVTEADALKWKREKNRNNPAHQYRLRKSLAEFDSRHAVNT